MHLLSPTSKAAGREAAQHSASSELTLLIFGIGTGVTARALLESSVLASSSQYCWLESTQATFIPQLSVKDQTAHLLLTAAEPFNAVLLQQLRQLHTGTHTLWTQCLVCTHLSSNSLKQQYKEVYVQTSHSVHRVYVQTSHSVHLHCVQTSHSVHLHCVQTRPT